MSEKPSPPQTMRGFVGDSMSTANFQAIRAAARASGKPASTAQPQDGWVSRADSMSSANFQGLAAKGKPAVQAASAKPAAPAPVKAPVRPQGR